jgi:hypothetical protein
VASAGIAVATALAGLSTGGAASATTSGADLHLGTNALPGGWGSFVAPAYDNDELNSWTFYRFYNDDGKLKTAGSKNMMDVVEYSNARIPTVGSQGLIYIDSKKCLASPKAVNTGKPAILVDCDSPSAPSDYSFLFKNTGAGRITVGDGYLGVSGPGLTTSRVGTTFHGETTDVWGGDASRIDVDQQDRSATLGGNWDAPDVRIRVNGVLGTRQGLRDWTHTVSGLDVGENTITIEYEVYYQGTWQLVKTETRTVTINGPSVPAPTASVVFDADVSKKAMVQGTGVAGGTITVKNGATTLGTATIDANGNWALPIDPIGAGKHTLTIEQTGIDGTQTTTVEADYGTAVTVSTPAPATQAQVPLSGTGTDGARISLVDGTGTTRTTTVANGTWTLTGTFTDGSTPVTVTSLSRGALTTTATTTVQTTIARQDVVVTSPTKADVDNNRIHSGTVTFTGTATPFATIVIDLWQNGRTLFTTTADAAGNWSGSGWVGESTYTPILKQTAAGSTTETPWYTFSTVAYQNLTDVRPTSTDTIRPSQAVFSGHGTEGAQIEVWTGAKNQTWARKVASGTVRNGSFRLLGTLTANNPYTLYTYQTLGANADFVVNSINTGAEIKDIAGVTATNTGTETTISGTAQPGATVEFWTGPKDASWAVKRFVATADDYGHFTTTAYLATGNPYTLHGYQNYAGTYFGSTVTLPFTPAP